MLKEYFIIFFITGLTSCWSIGENGTDNRIQYNDSSRVLRLDKFIMDSCLTNLFSSIADADKVTTNKPLNKVYSVTFFRDQKYLYLKVEHEYLRSMLRSDYFGFFTANNIFFLCRGGCPAELLKKSFGKQKKFNVIKSKETEDNITFIRDPFLQGTFYGCRGLAIKMEIYTTKDIPGFEMKRVK